MFFNVLKSRNKPSNEIKPKIKEHEHQRTLTSNQQEKKNEHHQIKEHQQEQTQENPHKTTPKPNQTIQSIETQQSTQLIHSQTKP